MVCNIMLAIYPAMRSGLCAAQKAAYIAAADAYEMGVAMLVAARVKRR